MASVSKKALRSQMRSVLKAVPSRDIQQQSQLISQQLQAIVANYPKGTASTRSIGCFLSMEQGEVDTKYILEWLFQNDHGLTSHLFLPRCTTTADTGQMKLRKDLTTGNAIDHPHLTFHRADSLNAINSWTPQGKYQLREPPLETPSPLPPHMDIMIVPGVAFNVDSGARIGWGAGYYDDFFKRYHLIHQSRPLLIGVALKQQIVSDIQLEPHDHLMDCIVVGDGTVHWIK